MERKEIQFCKDVYDRMIAGDYNPADLQETYQLISGDETAVSVRKKRQTLYAWHNYSFDATMLAVEPDNGEETHHTHNSTDGEEVTQEFGAEGLTLKEIAEGADPINTETTAESIDLIKSINTKKKIVTGKKPTGTKRKRTRKPKTDESK